MSLIARTPKQLGETLRRYRLRAGLSQTELATRAGIRQATVSTIEAGHAATRIDTITTLLAALDLEFTVAPRSKGSEQDIEAIF